MGAARLVTRVGTRAATRTGRRGWRMVAATVVGCLVGWWWDRPALVRPRSLEDPLETRAQWSAAVAWPGAAALSAIHPTGPHPFLLTSLLTGAASVIVGRRVMAARNRPWPLRTMSRDVAGWLRRSPLLVALLVAVVVVLPWWWSRPMTFDRPGSHAIPVLTVIGMTAWIALREARWRTRVERLLPRLAAAHKVREEVMTETRGTKGTATTRDTARLRPGRGREMVMVHVPAQVVTYLDGLDERLAVHLPEYEAVPRTGPSGVTSILYRPTGVETAERREILERTNGLITSLVPAGTDDPARPDEHLATIAEGVSPTRAAEIDAVLREAGGFSLVEWPEGARTLRVARLDEMTLDVRGRLAAHRRCRPWDLDLVCEWDETGTLTRLAVLRAPVITDPFKRRSEWLAAVRAVSPSPDDRRWIFQDLGEDRLALDLVADPLRKGFSIAEFADRFRDPNVSAAESWKTFPVALREDGEPIVYNLFHTLVIGQTGAGKGSVLWSVVSGLLPAMREGLVEIHAIDPKNAEAPSAPNLFKRIATEPDEWAPMLEDLVADLKERQKARGRSFQISRENPLRLIFVDEMSALTVLDGDNQRSKQVMQNLLVILSQGRSDGTIVLSAGQAPQKDMLGQARMFYALRVVLRTETALETDLVLGAGAVEEGAAAHLIPPANPGNGYATAGIGYMRVEGESAPVRVRFPYISDEQLAEWDAEFASLRTSLQGHMVVELSIEDLNVCMAENTTNSPSAEPGDLGDFDDESTPAPAQPLSDLWA